MNNSIAQIAIFATTALAETHYHYQSHHTGHQGPSRLFQFPHEHSEGWYLEKPLAWETHMNAFEQSRDFGSIENGQEDNAPDRSDSRLNFQ